MKRKRNERQGYSSITIQSIKNVSIVRQVEYDYDRVSLDYIFGGNLFHVSLHQTGGYSSDINRGCHLQDY